MMFDLDSTRVVAGRRREHALARAATARDMTGGPRLRPRLAGTLRALAERLDPSPGLDRRTEVTA